MGKNVDIRDVAALAGVSVGSASKVINGVEGVSVLTRQKVERAIAALNYRPNYAAQSLRSRSTKTIGCLFTDVANPLYAGVFRALEERLRREGYMLLLANGLNDPQLEIEALTTFSRRGMDGIIVAPGNERDEDVLKAIRGLQMPVVILDRDMDCACDAVLMDHVPAVRHVVTNLIQLGHRRIGLTLWRANIRPVRRRVEGFRSAHKAEGLPPPDLVVKAASATSSVFAEVHAMLQGEAPPTAIIVQGATNTLFSALQAIEANGLRIPEDVSVVALGDAELASEHIPAISTLNVDLPRMADEAAALLLSRMKDPALPPRTARISLIFTQRSSVAQAKKVASH